MGKFDIKELWNSIHITPKVKRYVVVMVLGVLLNELLAFLVVPLQLPLWLDMAGTALVAIVLEPTAGIIVAFCNNFILSIFRFDASSIIYLSLGAAVAIICGTRLKQKKDFTFKNIVITWMLVVIVTSALTAFMTMWRTNGLSDLAWEQYFYYMALDLQVPKLFACMFGAFVVKIPDMTVSTIAVYVTYHCLPRKWKQKEDSIINKEKPEK